MLFRRNKPDPYNLPDSQPRSQTADTSSMRGRLLISVERMIVSMLPNVENLDMKSSLMVKAATSFITDNVQKAQDADIEKAIHEFRKLSHYVLTGDEFAFDIESGQAISLLPGEVVQPAEPL